MRPHDLTRFQLLVRFGYDGARFHGVQPQGMGICAVNLRQDMDRHALRPGCISQEGPRQHLGPGLRSRKG